MATREDRLAKLLSPAGVEINGNQPWDPQLHDKTAYDKILGGGTLGIGDAYVDGLWDSDELDELISRVLGADLHRSIAMSPQLIASTAMARIVNMQSRRRSKEVATAHYDLPSELYESFLDPNMQYTCGYWREADDLNEAQRNKMDLIARKLGITAGMKVLDIGFGWGQLANYFAQEHGAEVTGITISETQHRYAKEHFDSPDYKLMDYRELDMPEHFDRVTAIGVIEHVGYKNYRPFMQTVRNLLNQDGMFLLQTIGNTKTTVTGDAWLSRYIFPNGMTPSEVQLATAAEGVLLKEDGHSFGSDYDKTLMAWFDNFNANWPGLEGRMIDESRPELGHYDEHFYRTWKYYLLMCAGSFRSRKAMQLWQNVYSKNGIRGGYESVR